MSGEDLSERWKREAAANEIRAKKVRKIALIVGGVLLVGGVAALMLGLGPGNKTRECRERGVKYYVGVGSYPTLANGAEADPIISDMCSRNSEAFR